MQLEGSQLLQRLKPLFQENFEKFGELGAAISVWQNGKPIVDLYGGFRDARREEPWTNDTLVLVWSATKGIGSACLLHALQERNIDIGQRVAEFWPQFAHAGKEEITLAQLLSHQAGLCALDRRVDILDYAAVVRALEEQRPLWPPGTAHGYHARTFGFLLDELVRRIAGKTLSDYWQEKFAGPLNLDFWIGLPEKENRRVATIYAAKAGKPPEPKQFYLDLVTPRTLARKTFTSPYGLHVISKMNDPAVRAKSIVSFGGIGSGASLAKFYSMLANGGKFDGRIFFSEKTMEWMTTTLADGHGSRLSNTDSIFRGLYEGFTERKAKNFRSVPKRLRTSWCGWQSRLCRPGEQTQFRLCHEPNGTADPAQRKIIAACGSDLWVGTTAGPAVVSACPRHGEQALVAPYQLIRQSL